MDGDEASRSPTILPSPMNINPSEGFHMRLISLAINFITLYYFAAPATMVQNIVLIRAQVRLKSGLPLNNWGFDPAHHSDLTYGFIQGTESFSNGPTSYADTFDG